MLIKKKNEAQCVLPAQDRLSPRKAALQDLPLNGQNLPQQEMVAFTQAAIEAARRKHPLPQNLLGVDPALSQKPCATGARPPKLVRKKSQTTLQLQIHTVAALPTAPTCDQQKDIDARKEFRAKLNRKHNTENQAVQHAVDNTIYDWAIKQDELLLQRFEAVTTPGALPMAQKAEAEHMIFCGLTPAIRDRARALVEMHNPFLRDLWRKVERPAEKERPKAVATGLSMHAQGSAKIVRGRTFERCNGKKTEMPAVARLVSDTGRVYWIAEPSSQGGFKSFCVGLTDDDKQVAVLMMRGPKGVNVFGGDSTDFVSVRQISREVQNLSAYSDNFEIFDAFCADGMYFVVIPLFDAGDLRQAFLRLPKNARYPTLLRILPILFEEILELQKKHKAVHSDIKVDNFLCESSGRVVLGDHGLTRKLGADGALLSNQAGTLLAPEQIADHRNTCAIDFWSLGATLGDLIVEPFVHKGAWVGNPHQLPQTAPEGHSEDNKYQQLFLAMRDNLDHFNQFRQYLFAERRDHTLSLSSLNGFVAKEQAAPHMAHLIVYYQKFYQAAPLIADFCMEHLLEPNPGLRSTERAEQLLQMARFMSAAVGGIEPAAYAAGNSKPPLMPLPKNPKIALCVDLLRATRGEATRQLAA